MRLQIGKRIRELRRARNITQENLAELLGVSFQSVSRWESDVCYPDMELLPVLGKIFDVTVDYLIGVDQYQEHEKVSEYLEQFQTVVPGECYVVGAWGRGETPFSKAGHPDGLVRYCGKSDQSGI